MKGYSTHCPDIADVRGDRFIGYSIRRMEAAKKVGIFGEQIRAEHQGMSRRNIQDSGIVSYGNGDRRLESFPDLAYEAAFTEIVELHTTASTLLRRRRAPGAFTGF